MGQYKVPQDVEAEDKILGPLTFRQFIYALIGFGWGAVSFGLFRSVPALMIIVGAPPVMLFTLLAFYRRDGQNFEQILVAMIAFFASPRKRIWVKEKVVETLRIEPMKQVVEEATQRDPRQVRSELEKIATLIDSRGWNLPPQPGSAQVLPNPAGQDRIVGAPASDAIAPDEPKVDMLDMQQSPLAQNLTALLNEAAEDVRAAALSRMTAPAPAPAAGPAPAYAVAQPPAYTAAPTPNATPMLNYDSASAPAPAPIPMPSPAPMPQTAQMAAPIPTPANVSGVTPAPSRDILMLATQSDDLPVSVVAAQASRIAAPLPEGQTVDLRNNAS